MRVRARDVFPNCPRYIHRMELVERSRFVPHADHETPIPDWKRREWAHDVLPAGDPPRQRISSRSGYGVVPGEARPHPRAQPLEEEPADEDETSDDDERQRRAAELRALRS